jgi:Condensation domain
MDDCFPLTSLQASMVLASLRAPRAGVYIVQEVCDSGPALDLELLQRAWLLIAGRYPALRTVFARTADGGLCQRVTAAPDFSWRELRALPPAVFPPALNKDLTSRFLPISFRRAPRPAASSIGEHKTNIHRYNRADGRLTVPRIQNVNSESVAHVVEVDANSFCEAVVLAVAELREEAVNPSQPVPMTEFTVAILRRPTEHRIRLRKVRIGRSIPSRMPAGITKRQHLVRC